MYNHLLFYCEFIVLNRKANTLTNKTDVNFTVLLNYTE